MISVAVGQTEGIHLSKLKRMLLNGFEPKNSDLEWSWQQAIRFQRLCDEVLEPIALQFDAPIIVLTGPKSPGSHAFSGGKPESKYLLGSAVEFIVDEVSGETVFSWLVNGVPFRFGELTLTHNETLVISLWEERVASGDCYREVWNNGKLLKRSVRCDV